MGAWVTSDVHPSKPHLRVIGAVVCDLVEHPNGLGGSVCESSRKPGLAKSSNSSSEHLGLLQRFPSGSRSSE